MRELYAVLAGLAGLGLAQHASAQDLAIVAPGVTIGASKFLLGYGAVAPPPAFKRFCIEAPEECAPRAARPASLDRS